LPSGNSYDELLADPSIAVGKLTLHEANSNKTEKKKVDFIGDEMTEA
jgi:hypothetical protein